METGEKTKNSLKKTKSNSVFNCGARWRACSHSDKMQRGKTAN